MTTNQPRSAGSRLWWIIRTTLLIFIILILVSAALAGLGYAGYLGVQEIQRSDNSLATRIDANEQNLNSLRDLVNSEFARGNPELAVQIDQLESELAALTRQLEALQTTQVGDTAVQAEQLNTLQAEVSTAVAQNSDLTGEMETVQAAVVALQSDLNSSGSRLDELGGEVDRLRLQLSGLDETMAELAASTTAARDGTTNNLQQTLTLLQLWSVLTHARLALLNDDVTVAETAVSQAITLANTLTTEPEGPIAEALARLQTRLDLAAAGFATNLPMVAQDLEAASQELTLLLSGPTPEAESDEATTTPASTPIPSTTPLPSPIPTALPSATATP